jgi:hypothetical protein
VRFDGKQISLFVPERNIYATAPVGPTLDATVDEVRDKLNIDIPGADLLVSDPYHSLIDGIQTGRYVGREPIGGMMTHHLAFTKKDVDFQIWIKEGPEPLPVRYVITSKGMPSQPQFTLELHGWQPNAPLERSTFSFTPPPGARRIQFTPSGPKPAP